MLMGRTLTTKPGIATAFTRKLPISQWPTERNRGLDLMFMICSIQQGGVNGHADDRRGETVWINLDKVTTMARVSPTETESSSSAEPKLLLARSQRT